MLDRDGSARDAVSPVRASAPFSVISFAAGPFLCGGARNLLYSHVAVPASAGCSVDGAGASGMRNRLQ